MEVMFARKEIKLYKELFSYMALYIKVLSEENHELAKFASTHGWKSKDERIKIGQDCRKKIESITKILYP